MDLNFRSVCMSVLYGLVRTAVKTMNTETIGETLGNGFTYAWEGLCPTPVPQIPQGSDPWASKVSILNLIEGYK